MLSGFLKSNYADSLEQKSAYEDTETNEVGDELEDQDSDSESSDNSLTRDLNGIGAFTGLRLPSFWSSEKTQQQTISRREQLSNFIEDLKCGFSLQSALDRFQTIRVLLESQVDAGIQNSVDTDSEDDDQYEPQIIKPAVEPKDVPLLDQVIIPQSKEPKRRRHHRHHYRHHHHKHSKHLHNNATNSEAEELTQVSESEMNDEMLLRQRIMKIRQLKISDENKNRLVQKLMMGAHYAKVRFVNDNGDEVFQITADKDAESELQPSNLRPEGTITDDDEDDDDEESDDEIIVTEEDKIATYHDDQEQQLGCEHYQRACKMECPKCKKWFGCPICHDEVITDHKFKRETTKHIMCMNCFHVQEPTEFCENCDTRFALYFCLKCKLYDNDEYKDIYHCDDCGICRLGLGLGQDFFHCKGCNACLAIELQDDHKCIERATQSDCPICGEFMFTSTKPVVFMSCGHAIHQHCFDDHSKHSYKCPTCQKTVLNMEAQFRVLDMEISLQPLPLPYCQWTCVVSCNDCNAKSSSPYHVLGLKCDNCKSYNTAQLKLIKPEETDYDSDISTATNRLRRNNIVRDLRTIPISSNLLNTNYNIENTVGANLNQASSSNTNTANLDKKSTIKKNIKKPEEGDQDRILTLPQQFLTNFDNFVNNIDLSNSEDDDFEDFLRVNRTLKSMKNDQMITSDDDNNGETSTNAGYSSRFFTDKIKGLIRSGRAAMMNDDQDETDDEDYESDDIVNGF